MAFEALGFCIPGVVAAADLSASQFRLVKIDGTGKVTLGSTLGAVVDGVLQDKPLAGQAASVAVSGVSKVEAGAGVTAGALVTTDATNRAITAGATQHAFGRALTSGAVGNLISVLLLPYGVQ